MLLRDSFVMPATKMGEKAGRYRDRRLPFTGRQRALRQPVENAPAKVDEGTALLRYG
jgi:hypothetical protein